MQIVHLSLSLLGFIPGYGAAFDIINAALYFTEGDYLNGALCLASSVYDVGNILSTLGSGMKLCKLAKVGNAMKVAGLGFTTATMGVVTGINLSNTISLYIDNGYKMNEAVIESMEATAVSALGTVMCGMALSNCYREARILEEAGAFCFTAGTKVLTEDGYKNIEDIQAGDRVYSTDEATGESGYKEVLQVFINETEVITHVLYEDKEGNIQEIETTLNHRFMCEGEWKAAGTLRPGDLLTLADGSQVPVTEVRFEDHHETVYNMEVEDYHTYYVGEDGVWVHNTYQGKTADVTTGVLDDASYAQRTYSNTFSPEGRKIYSDLVGEPIDTIDDLVNAINAGKVKVEELPIEYIVRDGNTLILNTRTSQALTQANIPRSQWNAVNKTGIIDYEDRLTGQLVRNKLTSKGTPTVRPSGGN